ncbi:TetR/AcrR family transcriptional regulator [Streptomyces sp. NPDC055692]|uniref:TetR/AcrR family transcriptional regulator n=1 Tax=Streptomyces sp. NPDC055692 TaxID=3155683 RepID=UPI00343B4112
MQGRRARTEKLVLDATRELLAERGVRGLTVEGVAERAGVAKTTIYRRYRSKTDLALAVLLDMVDDVATQPDVEDTHAELAAVVDRTLELLRSSLMGRVMQGLVSEVAADPELARAYRERVVNRRLADVRRLVERGIARGEMRPDLDPEMVTDLLLGPIYYRLFLSGSPLDDAFGEQLVTALRAHCRMEGGTGSG